MKPSSWSTETWKARVLFLDLLITWEWNEKNLDFLISMSRYLYHFEWQGCSFITVTQIQFFSYQSFISVKLFTYYEPDARRSKASKALAYHSFWGFVSGKGESKGAWFWFYKAVACIILEDNLQTTYQKARIIQHCQEFCLFILLGYRRKIVRYGCCIKAQKI